jgi:predicted amidophosphoribosyltransferase
MLRPLFHLKGKIMTELLERAFTQASKFSDIEQNLFAKWILAEMDSEQCWNRAFARSEDLLSRLADEAFAEHKAGKTQRLEPDNL